MQQEEITAYNRMKCCNTCAWYIPEIATCYCGTEDADYLGHKLLNNGVNCAGWEEKVK